MQTVRVTGQTFDHRDKLKSFGGRWDAAARNWVIDGVTPKDLATLKALPGCLVVDDTDPAPSRAKPADDSFDWFDKIRERIDGKSEAVTADRTSVIYGDDLTYFNYFKDKNPKSFFGFSSLGEMTKFVEAIPQHKRDGERNQGWVEGGKWYGTPGMKQAIDLARNGWSEGLEKSGQILELLNLENATQRKRAYSVAGGSVSVGRLLAGNPAHMVKRPKRPGRRSITLFVENTASSFIQPEMLIVRAAIVAAFADILEGRGYSCQLVAVTMQARSFSGDPGAQTAVTIKHAGEKLNLADIVFALGHPSFLRRFNFACVSQADECRDIWSTQGYPKPAFGREMNRNEFYVRHVTENYKGDFMEIARKMLPVIKPQGLPLTVNGEIENDDIDD